MIQHAYSFHYCFMLEPPFISTYLAHASRFQDVNFDYLSLQGSPPTTRLNQRESQPKARESIWLDCSIDIDFDSSALL